MPIGNSSTQWKRANAIRTDRADKAKKGSIILEKLALEFYSESIYNEERF